MLRFLVSLAAVVGIAFATYASAAVFSTASDPDLRCDTEGVTGTWVLSQNLDNVTGVRLTEIDPSCVDAETYVQALAGDTAAADSTTTLGGGNVGAGSVLMPLNPQSVQSITGLSVLMHKGSDPATGPAGEVPCALDGMRIQGWGVNNPAATVSSIRLTDIDTDCIGAELVATLDQGGNFLAEARATLTAGNTGGNILTLTLPSPLQVAIVTGIEIYVEGEEVEGPEAPEAPPEGPTGGGSPGTTGGTTTTTTTSSTSTSNNQSQVLGTRQTGSGGSTQSTPRSEVAGVRGLPSTGMGFVDNTEAGQAIYYFAVMVLVAGGCLLLYFLLTGRRRMQQD